MEINPEALTQLAQEWDPGPFLQAMEQAQAVPAGGSGDYANMLAPGNPAQPNPMAAMGMMQQGVQMQQPQAAAPRAPAVMPRQAPQMQMPQLPGRAQVPDLATILGRR